MKVIQTKIEQNDIISRELHITSETAVCEGSYSAWDVASHSVHQQEGRGEVLSLITCRACVRHSRWSRYEMRLIDDDHIKKESRQLKKWLANVLGWAEMYFVGLPGNHLRACFYFSLYNYRIKGSNQEWCWHKSQFFKTYQSATVMTHFVQ